MCDQHPPHETPSKNPPVDFIRIQGQAAYTSETMSYTYTATAARLKLASYALATRDSWRGIVTDEEAHALAYAPLGYYPSHNHNRAIEKHSPYHYELHRYDLCAAAGSLHYYANLEKAEASHV